MGVARFRVWSSILARMIHSDDHDTDCLIELNGHVRFEHGEHILMQCTGFNDVNGNELYVGDICQGSISIGCMVGDPMVGQVIYNPSEARYELQTQNSSVPLTMVSDMLLLGTIYENPDLLNVPASSR